MQASYKLGMVTVLALVCLAAPMLLLYRSESEHLRQQGELLREQAGELARAKADNTRLSNLLAQVRHAQAGANERLQELITLRAEVNRLRRQDAPPAPEAENPQREIARLKTEINRLNQENEQLLALRDELQQFRAAAEAAAAAEEAQEVPATEQVALSLRVIRTQGDSFAEKLRNSTAARDGEPFQDVFGRFLEMNGIQRSTVSAVYDERTGSIVVRAPQNTVDQIERLTSALDQSP